MPKDKASQNLLKAWRREGPEYIPISSGLPYLDWADFGYDPAELEHICMAHPILFPNYTEGTISRNHENVFKYYPDLVAGKPYKDDWGCVWTTMVTGMVGAVTYHPLADMREFSGFHAPDPDISDGLRKIDWTAIEGTAAAANRVDFNFFLGLPHGHTFLRAQDIRGYEDFICDLSDDDGDIIRMLDMISEFNMKLINRFITCRPDVISIPEDLGMQNSPMLSPKLFKKYIAPYYMCMTEPVKRAGILVHEHSDGYIMDLLDDLIITGGDVINLQDLVNGIDNLAEFAKGRMSIDLDIDRQNITVCGTPCDIHDHIRECVVKLGSREGGLSLTYQPWPPVPAVNLDAVFSAMEKYCVTDYIYR